MHFIESIGYSLLLYLPEHLRRLLFVELDLKRNEKFVLATLYYLDSKGRLDEFQQELPVQTGLTREECQDCLQRLARLRLIEYTQKSLRLKIKPLTYNKSC